MAKVICRSCLSDTEVTFYGKDKTFEKHRCPKCKVSASHQVDSDKWFMMLSQDDFVASPVGYRRHPIVQTSPHDEAFPFNQISGEA